jgi:hypothetical protein
VVNEETIQDRAYSNYVLVDLGLNLMVDIVVYRVLHVFREHILESILVVLVIVKDFNHHI